MIFSEIIENGGLNLLSKRSYCALSNFGRPAYLEAFLHYTVKLRGDIEDIEFNQLFKFDESMSSHY